MNDSTYEPMADDAIRLYNLCTTFNTLPKAGGILDQDYLQVWLLEQVSNAVAEKQEQENNKNRRR
jgi:hypothetical protein